MAKITQIQVVKKDIRITRRTVAEVGWNDRYFSLRTCDAGAEQGLHFRKEDIQLDHEQARILRDLLNAFLEKKG